MAFRLINKHSGQSTIEFLLTFVFALAFIFNFVQLAVNTGAGYLAHYTTFMASRSYLVYDDNSINPQTSDRGAELDARSQIDSKSGLDIIAIKNPEVSFNPPGNFPQKWEYTGVRMKIRKGFSPLSIVGGTVSASMISESFLGREPTRGTCLQRICNGIFAAHVGFACSFQAENLHLTLFDNGC